MVSEIKLGDNWSLKEEDASGDLIIEDRINTTELFRSATGGSFSLGAVDLDLNGNALTNIGGTTDASSGAIRLANDTSILARDSGNNSDFGITFGSSDAVEIDSADLRLATGKSIEDGSGTERISINRTDTVIYNESGDISFFARDASHNEVRAYSDAVWRVNDREGKFIGYKYLTSGSAPGTLELTNANLDAKQNDITNVGSLSTDELNINTPSSADSIVSNIGPTGFIRSSDTFTLADDTQQSIHSGAADTASIVVVNDESGNLEAIFAHSGSSLTKLDGNADIVTSDTDGKHCVLYDTGDIVVKNRTGSSNDYTALVIGA